MKGILQVIVPPETSDLDAAVRTALEVHRLDEDDLESIRRFHWDYWVFPEAELVDSELVARFPGASADVLRHASHVHNLALERVPSAVVTPDGRWHDVQEHGWRLMAGDSHSNRAALERWERHVQAVWREHARGIVVEVLYHC